MNTKSIFKYAVTCFLTVIVTLVAAFMLLGGDFTRVFEQIELMRKITTIDTKVNKNAVYFKSNNDEVGDALAQSYIDLIDDDYSAYFNDETYGEKQDEREGISNKSIGITIAIKGDEKYPSIVYVNRLSPANEQGIKVGDKLLKINGNSLKGKTTNETAELIKSEDTAKLTVRRNGKTLEFSVGLEEFILDSVMWRMVDDTCVIKITEFESSTVSQFDEAIEFAEKQGAKSLVFDLRNNPGGYVDACAEILDKICPEGDLVRMKYADGSIKETYRSDKSELDLPMAVIINSNTASAAEIFALNIRDLCEGKIVGEKSFGKGIAQTTYEIGDGTAVKFTTATIVDKDGETYHKKGIAPDIEVTFTDEQNKNYLFLTDNEDTQLKKALEIVK